MCYNSVIELMEKFVPMDEVKLNKKIEKYEPGQPFTKEDLNRLKKELAEKEAELLELRAKREIQEENP